MGTLNTEIDGLQRELQSLPVVARSGSPLVRELDARKDALESRKQLHTACTARVGHVHELIQQYKSRVEKNHASMQKIVERRNVITSLLASHESMLRHALIRKPNMRTYDLMKLTEEILSRLAQQDPTKMVRNQKIMSDIESDTGSNSIGGSAGVLKVIRISDQCIKDIIREAETKFQQEYFGGKDMLKDVGETMLELLKQNANARLLRNQFMRGALGHYHGRLETQAAQLLTQQLSYRNSLPSTHKRKMMEQVVGFLG